MAATLKNLIPSEVMKALIVTKLRKTQVAADVVARDYQDALTNAGDSVKIASIQTGGASSYTRNSTLTYSALDSASMILNMNQEKYFAYGIDLLDEKQSLANITNEVLRQASLDLTEAADTFLIQTTLRANAGTTDTTNLGASGSAISVWPHVNQSGTLHYLGTLSKALDEANVPMSDRFCLVTPAFYAGMVQEKVLESNGTSNEDAYANGRVGRCYGFDIRTSCNLDNYNTTSANILAGSKSACQFVDNLADVGILPLETKFGYGVRGLYVYGAKVVQTKAIASGWVTMNA